MTDKAKLVDVGGFRGVDASSDPDVGVMYQTDVLGTLGWLHRPYHEAAVILRYSETRKAWVLQRKTLLFFGGGTDGSVCGFTGTLDDDSTSALADGSLSSSAHFSVQTITLVEPEFEYTPDAVTVEDGKEMTVSCDGVMVDVSGALAGEVWRAFAASSVVEFGQIHRTCWALIGKVDESPEGGTLVLKRPLAFPPSNVQGFCFRLRTTRSIAIPFEGDEPDDGAVMVFTIRMRLDGYFSDAEGNPIVNSKTGDHAEARQAAKYPSLLLTPA
jgi:hypothetical protein